MSRLLFKNGVIVVVVCLVGCGGGAGGDVCTNPQPRRMILIVRLVPCP